MAVATCFGPAGGEFKRVISHHPKDSPPLMKEAGLGAQTWRSKTDPLDFKLGRHTSALNDQGCPAGQQGPQ